MRRYSPIIITGCARSGSSMVAGVLQRCGAFGGKTSGSSGENGRGDCENDGIHGEIIIPYLKEIKSDIYGQYPLPSTKKLLIPANWNKQVMYHLHNDGYVFDKGPWFYKSSKTCLIWPIWHYAFPDAKWIIVRRRTGDIISSCLQTEYMRAFRSKDTQGDVRVDNEIEGWKWWVRQHEQRFREMQDEGINCQVVWPERMVDGNYQQMQDVIEWVGLEWTTEAFNFIDPKLWRVRHYKSLKTNPIREVQHGEPSYSTGS